VVRKIENANVRAQNLLDIKLRTSGETNVVPNERASGGTEYAGTRLFDFAGYAV
jgi:hypothetical protein